MCIDLTMMSLSFEVKSTETVVVTNLIITLSDLMMATMVVMVTMMMKMVLTTAMICCCLKLNHNIVCKPPQLVANCPRF